MSDSGSRDCKSAWIQVSCTELSKFVLFTPMVFSYDTKSSIVHIPARLACECTYICACVYDALANCSEFSRETSHSLSSYVSDS